MCRHQRSALRRTEKNFRTAEDWPRGKEHNRGRFVRQSFPGAFRQAYALESRFEANGTEATTGANRPELAGTCPAGSCDVARGSPVLRVLRLAATCAPA